MLIYYQRLLKQYFFFYSTMCTCERAESSITLPEEHSATLLGDAFRKQVMLTQLFF